MPRTFLYCCPRTGQNGQGTVEGESPADGSKQYEALEWAGCRGFHFVNTATLKLLSDEIEGQPPR
jgi:hypothetical protein